MSAFRRTLKLLPTIHRSYHVTVNSKCSVVPPTAGIKRPRSVSKIKCKKFKYHDLAISNSLLLKLELCKYYTYYT